MLTVIWNIILTLLVFTFIVLVHEGGHFMMARKVGIYVEEFAIGMGPKLWSRTTKKGTVVSLRALPLGGFCQMKGETADVEEVGTEESVEAAVPKEPDPDSFAAKTVGQRALVVAAGPFMNFVLAFVLLFIFSMASGYTSKTVVRVDEGYPAAEAGLEVGDEITHLNGEAIHVYSKISFLLMNYQEGDEVTLTVKTQSGESKTMKFALKYDETLGRYRMGFSVGTHGSIAEETAQRGFLPALWGVILESFWELLYEIEVTIRSIGMLIAGQVGMDALTGPIGMVSVVGDVYEEASAYGLYTILATMASLIVLISANLGVLNLFPIPGLDGSRLVMLLIEKIRRKPMNPKIENAIYLVGFVLLFGLMIAVAFNDVMRIIQG